jgi:indole-3-glycerol phosphate synthase
MNFLDKIVATKREEVARLLPQAGRIKQAAAARTDYRDFAGALVGGSRFGATDVAGGLAEARPSERQVALIAEIKKASPSAGVIAPKFDAISIARDYEAAGASALSVLTDEKFFQGRIEYLQLIRDAVRLPLLRKDFIIDELQVYESVARGADAILLIVAILDDAQLRDYRALAEHFRLPALVEVHDDHELERALNAGAAIIGINNRDLRDFSVSLATTEKLTGQLKRGMCSDLVVSESGINTRADVERVRQAGVDAILVGESLMRSGDIAGKVKELMG